LERTARPRPKYSTEFASTCIAMSARACGAEGSVRLGRGRAERGARGGELPDEKSA
jgi:hypothetical protein